MACLWPSIVLRFFFTKDCSPNSSIQSLIFNIFQYLILGSHLRGAHLLRHPPCDIDFWSLKFGSPLSWPYTFRCVSVPIRHASPEMFLIYLQHISEKKWIFRPVIWVSRNFFAECYMCSYLGIIENLVVWFGGVIGGGGGELWDKGLMPLKFNIFFTN